MSEHAIPGRFVAIEAPIGLGKHGLAQRLAAHWQVALAGEDAASNPFLARYYQNFPSHALATQLAFLKSRGELARRMLGELLPAGPVVSDFIFEKDELFAHLTLDDDEYALYRALLPKVLPEYPTPDLVIYLQASDQTLLRQCSHLAARSGVNVPEGYLQRVNAAYNTFFHGYQAAPLLIVNADTLDLESEEDFGLLLRCINEMRGQRNYFNKGL